MTTCKEPHGGHPRRGARRGVGAPPPPHRSSERATTAPGRWPSPRTTTRARVPPHASRLSEDGPHGVPCRSLSPRALWSPTTMSSLSVSYTPKTFSYRLQKIPENYGHPQKPVSDILALNFTSMVRCGDVKAYWTQVFAGVPFFTNSSWCCRPRHSQYWHTVFYCFRRQVWCHSLRPAGMLMWSSSQRPTVIVRFLPPKNERGFSVTTPLALVSTHLKF